MEEKMAGKSQRQKREAFLQEMKKREEAEKIKKRKHRKIRLIAIVIVTAVLLCTLGGLFSWRTLEKNGYFLHRNISLCTDHFTVNNAMMTYFIQSAYFSDVDTYGEKTMASYNLDVNKKLADQTSGDSTWLDFYLKQTKEKVETMLTLAEASIDRGIALGDYENERIENTLSAIDLSRYQSGISKEDVRNCLKLLTLAAKCQKQLYDSITYTDENYETYYNNHISDYAEWDYVMCSFSLDSLEEKVALAYADELLDCTTEEAFATWIKGYYAETQPQLTDAELQAKTAACYVRGAGYTTDDVGDWAFSENAQEGMTFLYHNGSAKQYEVYYLLKKPYQNTEKTVTFRHILLTENTYQNDLAAETKAKEILASWQSDDPTEENFENLAHQYSEDSTSKSNGGLEEKTYRGELTQTAVNDWCFDPARKAGDTGIVMAEDGIHIIYYISDDMPKWQARINLARRATDYQVLYSTLTEKYTLTEITKGLDKINL